MGHQDQRAMVWQRRRWLVHEFGEIEIGMSKWGQARWGADVVEDAEENFRWQTMDCGATGCGLVAPPPYRDQEVANGVIDSRKLVVIDSWLI
ncbi:hypothetical protein TRAPUB_5750 [Trametes pubescens]|uniref:Uncharacterized protein n=1 Tax=Trametes pubescens TaxID=154538 RepID=A0A1M2V7L5_TRAPU|nr:hypothetical protein TRAPUB_5750 [Trametes pubescens]